MWTVWTWQVVEESRAGLLCVPLTSGSRRKERGKVMEANSGVSCRNLYQEIKFDQQATDERKKAVSMNDETEIWDSSFPANWFFWDGHAPITVKSKPVARSAPSQRRSKWRLAVRIGNNIPGRAGPQRQNHGVPNASQ